MPDGTAVHEQQVDIERLALTRYDSAELRFVGPYRVRHVVRQERERWLTLPRRRAGYVRERYRRGSLDFAWVRWSFQTKLRLLQYGQFPRSD